MTMSFRDEIVFRSFLKKVDSSDLPDREKRSAVSMCRFPDIRLPCPQWGCYHATHPQSAWTRVVFYARHGVTARCPRCSCCGSVLSFDLPKASRRSDAAHANCILMPPPRRADKPFVSGGMREAIVQCVARAALPCMPPCAHCLHTRGTNNTHTTV